jgi:ATP-dependent Clp protease adaptor protein ClpS
VARKGAPEAPEAGGEVLERTRTRAKPPQLFKVVLHNDDYTTMEFVVRVLETVFNKPTAEAFRIMLQVHTQGRGICGAYTWEIAETKVGAVHELARSEGFPLRASMEEE